jgi:hypothetical protein
VARLWRHGTCQTIKTDGEDSTSIERRDESRTARHFRRRPATGGRAGTRTAFRQQRCHSIAPRATTLL